MRKLRSRKGVTLVELVVTVAILGITAGMGVGIFASAMKNYSTASVVAVEQGKTAQIEEFVTRFARVCTSMYYVDQDAPSGVDPSTTIVLNPNDIDSLIIDMDNKKEISYMTIAPGTKTLTYRDVVRDYDGNQLELQNTSISGVERVEFSVFKQKVEVDPGDTAIADGRAFLYMKYSISMEGGYSVGGCVLLNNCSNITTVTNDRFVEIGKDIASFVVGDADTKTEGILFKGDYEES